MFHIIFVLFITSPLAKALECYVCTGVEGNWNDCIRTIQTCQPLQDACQSFVQYTTPPFWTVLASRRAFITKGCTTRSACQLTDEILANRCAVSETRDWICSYCCDSDRCNYYVPNSKVQLGSSLFVPILIIMLLIRFCK